MAKPNLFLEYALLVGVAVVAVFTLQIFVVKPYKIPSPSMVRTLEPGDRVLVNRLTYRFADPQRGDVIVFRWPPNRSVAFIKRVIGVPGDTLSLRDGRVYRNGLLLSEPYVYSVDGVAEQTVSHDAAADSGPPQPWMLNDAFTVPRGQYFVMGDHRTQSDDSRAWGTVGREDIIGKAFVVFWPLGRIDTL